MKTSELIALLERSIDKAGDLPVVVVCSSDGIGGDPIVVIDDGELMLDMDRFTSYDDHPGRMGPIYESDLDR